MDHDASAVLPAQPPREVSPLVVPAGTTGLKDDTRRSEGLPKSEASIAGWTWQSVLILTILSCLVIWLYWPVLRHLAWQWWDDENVCDIEDKDAQGRCPGDPEYDEWTRGEYEGGDDDEYLAEEYVGFEKLKGELAKKGATSPGGLAAYIGRKKYGKAAFQKAAAKGKKMGGETEQAMGTDPASPTLSTPPSGMISTVRASLASEVSPAGWSGTVHAMIRKGYAPKKPKMTEAKQQITNPYALAWWMKGRGYTPHYKPDSESGRPRKIVRAVLCEPRRFQQAS